MESSKTGNDEFDEINKNVDDGGGGGGGDDDIKSLQAEKEEESSGQQDAMASRILLFAEIEEELSLASVPMGKVVRKGKSPSKLPFTCVLSTRWL